MKRFTIPFLVASLLFCLTACGSTSRKLDRPRNEVAELHGTPTGITLLGPAYTILFTSLDGTAFEKSWAASHPDVLDVMPGKHRVGVYYSVKFDGQPGPSGDLEVEIDAVAGQTYQAHLLFHKDKGWWVEFHEKATKLAPAGTEQD